MHIGIEAPYPNFNTKENCVSDYLNMNIILMQDRDFIYGFDKNIPNISGMLSIVSQILY